MFSHLDITLRENLKKTRKGIYPFGENLYQKLEINVHDISKAMQYRQLGPLSDSDEILCH